MRIHFFFRSLFIVALLAATAQSAQALTLSSNSIQAGKVLGMNQVFNGFGCEGKNLSPHLKWSDVPEGTKALAITMYDPDAPTGSGWWHWVAFNLPPSTAEIPEGASLTSMPAGTVESLTDYGSKGFGGACPPKGNSPHRYVVTLFALKDIIPLKANASGALVGFYLHQNALAKATLEAKYSR